MKKYNYIYLITNLLNNKLYVGKHSTDNLDDGYMGSGILITRSIKKHGIEHFEKKYLAFCDTEEKLNWFEKFYIRKYNTLADGYNLTAGGDGGNTGITEEGRKKQAASQIGRKKSEQEILKIRDAIKNDRLKHPEKYVDNPNRKHTEEQKKKISEAHKGKKHIKYLYYNGGHFYLMYASIKGRFFKNYELKLKFKKNG